jgi:hypothetical protein
LLSLVVVVVLLKVGKLVVAVVAVFVQQLQLQVVVDP